MAKERLSKLQKWILARCLTKIRIQRCEIRRFFGKVFYPIPGKRVYMQPNEAEKRWKKQGCGPEDFEVTKTPPEFWMYPKPELRSTLSIEATISRTFRNLRKKGLIQGKGRINLTEKGFLIVNKRIKATHLLTFSEYAGKVQKLEEEERVLKMNPEKIIKMAKIFGINFDK